MAVYFHTYAQVIEDLNTVLKVGRKQKLDHEHTHSKLFNLVSTYEHFEITKLLSRSRRITY